MSTEQCYREEKLDQDMSYIKTQIDFLTIHLLANGVEKDKVVCSHSRAVEPNSEKKPTI